MTADVMPAQAGYDLFVSYRSAKSGRHAVALRDALYALDKRHIGDRPIRIFLDRVSLRAGTLDRNIDSGLLASRNLVVLLDETTIQSTWVDEEIRDWLAAGGAPDRLFLVRTSRELDLRWDREAHDFRNAAALPPSLAGLFREEQKYIDFVVPPRRVGEVDLVALYSTVMQVDPETMGEDERRFLQKQRRRSRGFTSALAVALAVSLLAGGIAVANYARADASARQSTADALAADSLLTLPVAPARAIDLAVEASRLADSASIRSALLAVASDSRLLQRTFSLTEDGQAVALSGLALGPDDGTLTGWGPTQSGAETGVVTWSVTSGDVMQSFTIPRPAVESLTEVTGVAYLACAGEEALRVDWNTHAVRVLSPKHMGCRASAFGAGGVLETVVNEADTELLGVTVTGQEIRRLGALAPASRSSINRVVLEQGRAVAVVWGGGVLELPEDVRGTLESDTSEAFLTRDQGGHYHALSVEGATLRRSDAQPPAAAVDVIAWRDYTQELKLAWVTATGELSWTGAKAPVQLVSDVAISPATAAQAPYGPTLTATGYSTALATLGTTVFYVSPGLTPRVDRLGEVPQPSGERNLVVKSCRGGVVALLGSDTYLAGGTLHTGRAQVRNCHAIEAGPPVRVDGKVTVEGAFADDQLSEIGQNGEILMARADGLISMFASADAEAVPWRVTSGLKVLVSPNTQATLVDGDPLAVETAAGRQTLGVGATGRWVVARPDGRGGIFATGSQTWLGAIGEIPQMLDDLCSASHFEPAAGFTTDVTAAAAQQAVTDSADTRIDCLSGEQLPTAPKILSYVVADTGSHIVSRESARVRVTRWVGSAGLTSVELPGLHPDATFAAMNPAGDRVLVGSARASDLVEYRWDGSAWRSGERYATTVGAPAYAAYSPDGALIVAVSTRGQFDVFDAASTRRLATQHTSLVANETYSGLSLKQEGGFVLAFLSGSKGSTLVEFPSATTELRDLLCGVHRAPAC